MGGRFSALRAALPGALAVVLLLALPALHPGAWAHGTFDPGLAPGVADAPEAPLSVADAHLRCPLCHALAQARVAIVPAAMPAPTGLVAPILRLDPEPGADAPPAARRGGPGPRAPPCPA